MKYFIILFFALGLLVSAADGKQEELEVKKLLPDLETSKKDTKTDAKRDPFWSFLKDKGEKAESMETLTFNELKLEGIVKMKNGTFYALFTSPKGKPFTATVGEKLFNGKIIKITINEVVFKKKGIGK